MAIESFIKDANGKHTANVQSREGKNCLHVLTQEYKRYLNKSEYLVSDTYGIEMAQDFTSVASTENVHNGNDNTYWTATTIVGIPNDFDFSSTDIAHTGTQSIDCTGSEGGDQFQLANDTLIPATKYDRFIGWVYVTGAWGLPGDGLEIILYNTNTGLQVSENSVDLDDYINGVNEDEWQFFNIPLSDFGLITDDFDAIRCTVLEEDAPPNFYLDDLALEELSDDPAIFYVRPNRGRWWHVTGLGMIIVSPYNSTLADATMPNIPYNGILGTSLTNGILYQRQEEGEVIFSIGINDMADILNQYDTRITGYGYDGNYTWVKIDTTFHTPFILKPEYDDFFSVNLSDDLSNLTRFRLVAAIAEEKRTTKGLYEDDQR